MLELIGTWVNIFASVATVVSVFFLAFQIRAEGKIAKTKLTFEMIEELENFITQNHPKCIFAIIGVDKSSDKQPADILENHRRELYDVLNFFERLSLAQKIDAINTTVLMQMYGIRIKEAYERLKPYIDQIQLQTGGGQGRQDRNKPYQHFDEFGYELQKKYTR